MISTCDFLSVCLCFVLFIGLFPFRASSLIYNKVEVEALLRQRNERHSCALQQSIVSEAAASLLYKRWVVRNTVLLVAAAVENSRKPIDDFSSSSLHHRL